MSEDVVVECRDCSFHESFDTLGRARVDSGVEQAGADAGVCGIPGIENPDTPLLDWQQSDEDS